MPDPSSSRDDSGLPLVAMRNIVKRFGTFTANAGINLDIFKGEAHALLGENGAGKSTLVKILYGLLEPTEGEILFEGKAVSFANPEAARAMGIGMVFQHFSLFDNLSVAENIALVLPKGDSLKNLNTRIDAVAMRYGLKLEPERPVWSLSAGERQRIEIARCLLQDPKLIVLDEPTSVLTPQEAETLFATLDVLKSEGRAILYISHRLEEVRRLCDRATVLRAGRVVGTCDPKAETARSLAAMMVGTHLVDVRAMPADDLGPERLAVQNLSMPAADLHGVSLSDISLSVHAGEVLGIAGIAGNGQDELFAAISGEHPAQQQGSVRIDGLGVGCEGITARRQFGAAFVPEERNGHAAAPDFSLSQNVVLSRHATGGVSRNGFLDLPASRALAREIIGKFDVRASGVDPAARTLSGGNLQKFLVGREISRTPSVLVLNQPTWGVDASASAAIRQMLIDLSRAGSAVLVISQDLDELFEISDRLAVIHDGHLSPPLQTRATTREEIGLLMGGATMADLAHAH
ncbi:MAG: transporter related [Hyphomicrobiales bacterium]|nr:transporter related [Hyphomicrobiales bacterium]